LRHLWGYTLALILPILTFLVRIYLPVSLDKHAMLILFLPSIIIGAGLGGIGSGLIATLASAACATYLLIHPADTIDVPTGHDIFQWGVLVLSGVMVSLLSENLHRARQSEAARGQQLEASLAQSKQAEEALQRENTKNEAFLRNVSDGVCILTAEGNLIEASESFCTMLGYSHEEMLAINVFQWEAGLTDAELIGMLGQHFRRPARSRFETRLRRKDGNIFDVEVNCAPVELDDQSVLFYSFRDISERKQAGKTLHESEERFRLLVEQSVDGILVHDAQSRYVDANPAACRMLGYSREEILSLTVADMVEEDEIPRIAPDVDRFASGQTRPSHYRCRRKDGSIFIGEVTGSQLPDGLFLGILRDVTERRQAEEALRQSQEEQQIILDNTPAMIWYKDTQNRILRVNASAAKSIGIQKEAIEGKHTSEFYPDDAERYYQDDLIVAQAGLPRLGIEESYRLPSGETRWLRTDKIPLKHDSGRVTRILVISTDITERKRVEEALQEADRRKDEFLATLAHELRNPLMPISVGIQTLRLTRDKPEVASRVLDMMEDQMRHMVRLIDDLLDLSRITLGKIELHKAPVELADVVGLAVELSRPLIDQAGHEFHVQVPARPIRVEGDLTRLAQAIANLLNNAAKFTRPGGVIVLTGEREGQEALVRVRDNGIGIQREMLDSVFDIFTQADRSLEKSRGGLGIGLSLVKRLVGLHGGVVEAHSEGLGKGSEFIVRLPALELPAHEAAPLATGDETVANVSAKRRILIADDNANVVIGMTFWLEAMGYEVLTARDGLEAVEVAARFRPELILLDIGMPGLNGYDVCRRIRTEPWGHNITIVAVTGWGRDQDRKLSQEAGFDHHLVKPVDLGVLKTLLAASD